TGEGFYVWKKGKIETSDETFDKAAMERLGRELVEPMIVEAQKSLDEHVVETTDLVDAGLIFGTGFAPFRGGPLHYKASEASAATARAAAE
ncbi:MAG: 3-hydroxyacyl-CoA dehydrogenase, partial [Hyphomicrobium sp.]